MKKKDLVLIIGAILIVVLAFFAMGNTNANPEIEVPLALSGEENGLIKIDYSTYESKIKNGENFIIVIERTGCSYCEMYMPVLESVTKEFSIPVYYIDTADLTQDEYESLGESNSYLKRERWGTPTTLLMSGQVVVDSLGGYVDETEFTKFIKENVILSSEEKNDVE